MAPNRKYAFFDLDYTLIPCDTLVLFANYILKKQRWRSFYLFYVSPFLLPAMLRWLDSGQIKRRFLSFLWRMSPEELDAHCQSFVQDEVLPRLYGEVVERLQELQSQGFTTVLNTASPEIYVEYIARALKFDAFYGTPMALSPVLPLNQIFLRPNNKRTQKLIAMQERLPDSLRQKLSNPFDFQTFYENHIPGAIAFTDSSADLPLLSIAEKGVLVHPSRKLALFAEGKKWEIIRPRRPYQNSVQKNLRAALMALGLFYG